jgi:hypothetical protein
LDAIGTTHECLHSIKQKHLKALILKLDLKKAYDCINWDFLRMILIQTGFGLLTTNWVMSCVTSATFAVLVNGETTSFFRVVGDLRQGCPLSPLTVYSCNGGPQSSFKNRTGGKKFFYRCKGLTNYKDSTSFLCGRCSHNVQSFIIGMERD